MGLQDLRLDGRLDGRPIDRHKDSLRFTERALRSLPLASEPHKLDESQRQQAERTGHYDVWEIDLPYWVCRVGRRDRVLYVVRKLRGAGKPVWFRQGVVGDSPLAQYRTDAEGIAARLNKGDDPRAPKVRAVDGVLTLDGAFTAYLQAKGTKLAPSTIDTYKRDFDAMFDDWRTRPFASITPDMVQRRHRERSKDSPTRADGALRVLRAVHRYITRNAIADGKPLAIADPLVKVNIAQTWNGTPARKTYLDDRMRPAWLASVRALPDDKPPALSGTQRDALLLLIATGLRLREGVQLAWSEVDLKRGVVTLAADRMKGDDEHAIPIPRRTLAMLAKRRKADPDGVYVFANNGEPIDRISRHVLDRVDIKVTPHDLRRSIATWLGTNAPAYVVKQILSHADPAKSKDITERYVQRDVDAMRVWVQKWEDALYAKPKRTRK